MVLCRIADFVVEKPSVLNILRVEKFGHSDIFKMAIFTFNSPIFGQKHVIDGPFLVSDALTVLKSRKFLASRHILVRNFPQVDHMVLDSGNSFIFRVFIKIA